MNEESKKVSIVLPTYNGAEYIRQSIDSCLNQTYKNIELIIVDDGSTDKTHEIVKSYRDKRIKFIQHKKNNGLPNALNTGFANAIGDYLTWTSDDNFYVKEALEKMLSFLKAKNCDFVYCDYNIIKDDNLSNQNLNKLSANVRLENANHIGPCFLYSKRVKKIIGNYDPDTELAEDYDYWIRVSKKFTMFHLNQPLYFFREHKESLYQTKYYEVKIVDYLVRLKNKISNIEQVTNLFIILIAQKKVSCYGFLFHRINILCRILFKFNIMKNKILVNKKINEILRDFQTRKISFTSAKLKLKSFIKGR